MQGLYAANYCLPSGTVMQDRAPHDAFTNTAPFSHTVCRAAAKRGFLDCSSTAPFSSRIQVSDSAASWPLRSRITRAP